MKKKKKGIRLLIGLHGIKMEREYKAMVKRRSRKMRKK